MELFAPHETGEQPTPDALVAPGLASGLIWAATPATIVRASLGRRTRFPTMREWFDGALGRFIANPNLRGESAWLGEAGVEQRGNEYAVEATAFARLVDGTIDQETLADGRRQRINLGGSRAFGIELRGEAQLGFARVDGHLMLMHARGRTVAERSRLLAETPGLIGYLAVSRSPGHGISGAAEAHVTGAAYSRGPDGLIRLPPWVTLNARVGWRWRSGVEVFARMQNVLDAVVLPQAGLPAAGREVRAGVRVAFGGLSRWLPLR
jgi:iron complex outermembrane receptor protein